MKKILFASTALIASAGVAAAELTIGGSARLGLAYDESQTDNETRVEQRMRVNITGIAETDAGVKLEVRFRLEANEDSHANDISGRGPGAAGFAASFGGLRVDVGNVSNVLDSGDQVDYFGYGVGFTAFLEHNNAFNGPATGFGAGDADATTIKARYTVGDFSASLSYKETRAQAAVVTTDSNGDTTTTTAAVAADDEMQLGLGYTFGSGMSVGAVYSDTDSSGDYWVINLAGSAGAFGYSVIVGDGDNQTDTSIGASLNYEVSSATSIRAVVSDGGNNADTSYGLGFRHGLGGGVTLAGGVGSLNDVTKADLGVTFSF
ncbi:porin [Tritonibacter horizontis]|uniref:Porin n=1 Tax=Tritonibacter horizontis TaxID=1768241 RepID=A0A132C4N6_9RHOB|nr:porin [Tritonibacter horizontis]KUP95030.1 porin [Tritonibacter horizontis]